MQNCAHYAMITNVHIAVCYIVVTNQMGILEIKMQMFVFYIFNPILHSIFEMY